MCSIFWTLLGRSRDYAWPERLAAAVDTVLRGRKYRRRGMV